jgi:hypothetical protein
VLNPIIISPIELVRPLSTSCLKLKHATRCDPRPSSSLPGAETKLEQKKKKKMKKERKNLSA